MARRSVLFAPGDRPDRMRKATTTGADAVVFDLEDAVPPDGRPAAREAVRAVLDDLAAADGANGDGPGGANSGAPDGADGDAPDRATGDADGAGTDTSDGDGNGDGGDDNGDGHGGDDVDPAPEVCVRVSPPGRGGAADLDVVLDGAPPDALVLPKAATAADVTDLAALAAERGADLPVLALVETAAGVLGAEAIAAADPTDALIFGAEDLAADLGATRTAGGEEVLYAREHVVLAATAAGVDAIDTVYTDFEDEAGLREETEFALQLGYDGKLAIHPAQVGPINETFTPDPERVAWARKVLDARETAAAEGRAVFAVDGEMVDAPLLAQAEQVLERARAAGVDPDEE